MGVPLVPVLGCTFIPWRLSCVSGFGVFFFLFFVLDIMRERVFEFRLGDQLKLKASMSQN